MTTEEQIVEVKTLRQEGDKVIQRVRALPPSRERSLTVTKLQEAVMWLGMDLKRINDEGGGNVQGAQNPYPNSRDPSNTKIDPTADKLKL